MSKKILGMMGSCGECPNCTYYSGGMYHCKIVQEIVRDRNVVAPFCPLADFPSAQIAGMDMTIRGLRESHNFSLTFAILSHIAARLHICLPPRGSDLLIPLQGNSAIKFPLDGIVQIATNPTAVIFTDGENTYKILPDPTPPELYVRHDSKESLWRSLKIASV